MQAQRMMDEFKNEPFTDYSTPENEAAMRAAIEKVRGELGREYPVVINGEKVSLPSKFESINPANKKEVVGVFSEVDTDTSLVDKAIDAATAAFKVWKNVSPAERAEYLFKIADIMRQRKHELSAWMIYEVAKTWAEADGDTAVVYEGVMLTFPDIIAAKRTPCTLSERAIKQALRTYLRCTHNLLKAPGPSDWLASVN